MADSVGSGLTAVGWGSPATKLQRRFKAVVSFSIWLERHGQRVLDRFKGHVLEHGAIDSTPPHNNVEPQAPSPKQIYQYIRESAIRLNPKPLGISNNSAPYRARYSSVSGEF